MGEQMTNEEEFEEWFKSETWRKVPPKYATEVKPFQREAWLEKGKRDREKVTEVVNDILFYTLPYLADKKLRKLLEEMK